ncbi:MAG: hypothetical protein J5803_04910 [Desulfovibrio sp.]|nr:hypothetical protein [Desulfovibrio sp.]
MLDTLILSTVSLLHDLVQALAQATSALPCAILFALLMMVRGSKQDLAFLTARALTFLFLAFLLFGPLATVGSLALFIAKMTLSGQSWQMPSLFAPALLPYTVNCGLWLSALPIALIQYALLSQKDQKNERAPVAKKTAILLSFLLILLLFSAWFALSWPFAGLPEGMTVSQAFFAILSHTEHLYFFALLPCALLLSMLFPRLSKFLATHGLSHNDTERLLRCIAGTGFLAGLPRILNTWGTTIGYLIRKHDMPQNLFLNLLQNTALTGTLLALGLLTINKWQGYQKILRLAALLFFFLSLFLPHFAILF